MPLRPARPTDLPSIVRIYAAGFWDEEVVGDVMHPYRAKYPHDYLGFWRAKVWERYWDYSHKFLVAYEIVAEEGGGEREVLTGVADWVRQGRGWEDVWGVSRWSPRNLISPLIRFFSTAISRIFPNRAADPAKLNLEAAIFPHFAHLWSGRRANCWNLLCLAVRPEYQHRGHGRQLVKWGLDRAVQDRVAASVVAAHRKDAFYRRCGFDAEAGRATDGVGNPLRGKIQGGAIFFKDSKADDKSGGTKPAEAGIDRPQWSRESRNGLFPA